MGILGAMHAIPISAQLVMSDAAKQRLEAATTRADKKAALHAVHDEVLATLRPRLEALRDGGDILDFATSWLMFEAVVHATPDRASTVRTALMTYPELRGVTSDEKVARARLRKLL